MRHSGRDVDAADEVFFVEQFSFADMAFSLLSIGAHVTATSTEMIREPSVTPANYFAGVAVKGRRLRARVTSSTEQA